MIQSLETVDKIQGGNQRGEKTDSGLRNHTRKSENRKRNTITDVPGVLVGHCTVNTEENHTGVTVIIPGPDNAFANHYTAAAYVHNGFGKSAGLVQVEELGTLETPIALTNTLNVGKVWDALAGIVIEQCQNNGLEPMSITRSLASAMTAGSTRSRNVQLVKKKCDRLLRSLPRSSKKGMSAPVQVPSATA